MPSLVNLIVFSTFLFTKDLNIAYKSNILHLGRDLSVEKDNVE